MSKKKYAATPDLTASLTEAEVLRRTIKRLNRELVAAETSARNELSEILGTNRGDVFLGSKKCADSPSGHCVYDSFLDINHERCLICGTSAHHR